MALTRDKGFKRLIRARASAMGERYSHARQELLRQREEARMVPVTCEIKVQTLTEERLRELRQKWEAEHGAEIEKARQENPEAIVRPPFSEEQGVMVLKEVEGSRELCIWCGRVEATAIAFGLQGIETQRPMTHDLLRDVVGAMGMAREVRITDLRNDTFFAELVVVDNAKEERTVSCRPSDGVAFAVRAGIPILVAEHLLMPGDAARPA